MEKEEGSGPRSFLSSWGAPFSIPVTPSLASRRVAGTRKPWPLFTVGTQF